MALVTKAISKKINRIDPYPTLESVPLYFTIECCNTKKKHSYSFEEFPKKYGDLSRGFAWAILSHRSTVGHIRREKYLTVIRSFYKYLDETNIQVRIGHPYQIDAAFLRHYAQHLRNQEQNAYSTRSLVYRSLTVLIKRWIGRTWASPNLAIPSAQFPGASRTACAREPYSDYELKQIVKFIKKDLEESGKKLESPYVPKYLGKPAPVDDVAPYDELQPLALQHDIWQSEDYRIWWWENFCKCQKLKVGEIAKIKKGSTFLRSLTGIWKRQGAIGLGTADRLNKFYKKIGAGDDYVPKFLNKPCPILYTNRWKKLEYLQWHWENYCDCSLDVYAVIRSRYPRFVDAACQYHGSLVPFFKFIGIAHRLTVDDLIPYYLAILISTALNPSTVRNLTIDCLSVDPLDSRKSSLNWTKLRARNQGQTIPSKSFNGISPVSIVERLIVVTSAIRSSNQVQLFLTNSAASGSRTGHALTATVFERAVQRWFKKHDIRDSENLKSLGSAGRFRNTIAQHEYRRTGDLLYVKTLLAHSRSEQTSSYITKAGDPVLRFRRGIHLEALFVGITSDRQSAQSIIDDHGISSQSLREISTKNISESTIAHCRNPKASPVHGQRIGIECNAHDVCLYCQNLVVTERDLVRYFAYIFYHEHQLSNGILSPSEFETVTGERRYMFENFILPRYNQVMILSSREEAKLNPPLEWQLT